MFESEVCHEKQQNKFGYVMISNRYQWYLGLVCIVTAIAVSSS